jgi:hypothetical protein
MTPGLTRVKKGTITIILVGETGVGKTAFMSLLANVCAERQIDDFRLEHNTANESNLSKSQSQTNKAMMYTFKRRDGCTLRILDTPGLCDTRGLEQDKEHKKSIAEAIKAQVQTLDGVIIMANGTLERVGPGVDYALHTLSTMFPRSIVNNIGFMFTNVPDALSFNFQSNTLPEALRNAERWTIQNPVAQFVKYQEAKSNSSRRSQSEQQLRALQRLLHSNFAISMDTLNDFFAFLDERKAQPTNIILELYEMTTRIEAAISNVLAQIDQREQQRMDLQRLQANLEKSNQVRLADFFSACLFDKHCSDNEYLPRVRVDHVANHACSNRYLSPQYAMYRSRLLFKLPRILRPGISPGPERNRAPLCGV